MLGFYAQIVGIQLDEKDNYGLSVDGTPEVVSVTNSAFIILRFKGSDDKLTVGQDDLARSLGVAPEDFVPKVGMGYAVNFSGLQDVKQTAE